MATRHTGDVDLEPLTPIDLEDAEVGIRPEDRYAAIPPGPKLIRRRVHEESRWAPAWLLGGLVVLFVIGALLGRSGGGDTESSPAARPGDPPPLRTVTGERVLLLGGGGIANYDIDDRTVTGVRGDGFSGPVTAAARTNVGVVVISRERAYLLEDDKAIDLGPAVDVAGSDVRGWIVSRASPGLLAAHVVLGPQFTPGDVVLPAGTVRVTAVGGRLVAERVEADGTSAIELLTPKAPGEPRRLINRGNVLLGAAADTIASRGECDPDGCALVLEDVPTRRERSLAGALPSGIRTAVFSPDGDWLFVQTGNRIEAVDSGTGQRFSVGELPSEYPVLAG
ncbi:MAG: hypothetical protein ACRDWD_10145 [Acidimicrobiia bacterium]